MSGLGGFGGLSFELGGRPSAEERIYRMLRHLVGEGGSAADDLEVRTIDGLWRFSRAAGLASIEASEEAAHWQAWPHTATDFIGEYEEILGILPSFLTENERRQIVVERWTTPPSADLVSIADLIESIDPRAQLLTYGWDANTTVEAGKVYDTLGAAGSFMDGRTGSLFPNYSTAFLVPILLDIGTGVSPIGADLRARTRLEELLDEVLPAWNDWVVPLDLGFTLDTSLLDVTAFDE